MRGIGQKISHGQILRAMRLSAQGKNWSEIAAAVGASVTGIRRHLDPEFRAMANNSSKRHKNKHYRRDSAATPVHTMRPPDHLLEDRERRATTPRSLTAEFFGDPPPGYSALDKKRAGLATP